MSETKSVVQSKTVAGIILMLVPVAAKLVGIEFGEGDVQALQLMIDQVTPLVGATLAFYGRMVAKTNLKF